MTDRESGARLLRRLREGRGWSLADLARALRDTALQLAVASLTDRQVASIQRTVARWESVSDRTSPSDRYQFLLAHLYSRTPADELALGPGSDFGTLLDALRYFGTPPQRVRQLVELVTHSMRSDVDPSIWKRTERPSVLEPSWSIIGTTQILREISGGSMDRRDFLIITGITLADLGDRWGRALANVERPRTPVTTAEEPRLSATVLDQLDRRLSDLRQLDDQFGGRELHQLAVAEFEWLTRLADRGNYSNATGKRLFSMVTEAARLCGWLHFDVARHASAQTYYVAALRCSATANDSLAGAHVLACMSFQATLTGHHQEAVALIDAAEERTKHTGTPRLRALLASRKARAYAKAGDAASCGRALNEAERRLNTTMSQTPEPSWIYYFNEAELDAQAAACWVDLNKPAKARPLIDKALGTMNPQYLRDRTIYHVRSAQAHLNANALEQACDDLHTAADLASQTGSVRSIDTIQAARNSMSRYGSEPRVRKLDRRLADLAT